MIELLVGASDPSELRENSVSELDPWLPMKMYLPFGSGTTSRGLAPAVGLVFVRVVSTPVVVSMLYCEIVVVPELAT